MLCDVVPNGTSGNGTGVNGTGGTRLIIYVGE